MQKYITSNEYTERIDLTFKKETGKKMSFFFTSKKKFKYQTRKVFFHRKCCHLFLCIIIFLGKCYFLFCSELCNNDWLEKPINFWHHKNTYTLCLRRSTFIGNEIGDLGSNPVWNCIHLCINAFGNPFFLTRQQWINSRAVWVL